MTVKWVGSINPWLPNTSSGGPSWPGLSTPDFSVSRHRWGSLLQLAQTLKELKLEGHLVMASHSKSVFEGHVGGIPHSFPFVPRAPTSPTCSSSSPSRAGLRWVSPLRHLLEVEVRRQNDSSFHGSCAWSHNLIFSHSLLYLKDQGSHVEMPWNCPLLKSWIRNDDWMGPLPQWTHCKLDLGKLHLAIWRPCVQTLARGMVIPCVFSCQCPLIHSVLQPA